MGFPKKIKQHRHAILRLRGVTSDVMIIAVSPRNCHLLPQNETNGYLSWIPNHGWWKKVVSSCVIHSTTIVVQALSGNLSGIEIYQKSVAIPPMFILAQKLSQAKLLVEGGWVVHWVLVKQKYIRPLLKWWSFQKTICLIWAILL